MQNRSFEDNAELIAWTALINTSAIATFEPDKSLKNIQLELRGRVIEAPKIQLPEKEAAYPEYDIFGKVMPVYCIYARHNRGVKFQNVRTAVLKPDDRPATVYTVYIDVEN